MEATTTSYNRLVIPFYYIVPLIVIIEGFVSISAEILTIRQLLPVAGGSVIVTSLIIGIFLLFLALGYQFGGLQRLKPQAALRRNFFIASLWIGIGLSYPFVNFCFECIQKILGPHVLYPLLLYLLLVIAPLIYILGQTVPITMNMVKQDRLAGVIGGKTLSLSTVGSFLGAVLTTLVILHFFGVGWAIFTNCMLLIALALLLTETVNTLWIEVCIIVFFAIFIFIFNIGTEKALFDRTNNYANYQILTAKNSALRPDEKILVINAALSSYTNAERKGFPYIEMIKKILFFDLKLQGQNILVLGAGGFSLSAGYSFGNHFTYVDIDKEIKRIAVPAFRESLDSKLVVDDARHYLQSGKETFAAIVTDVYSDIKAIPAHLLTREYMKSVKARLDPNGYALFNIIANPMFSDSYSKRIDNTIRSIFSTCVVIPLNYADYPTNIIYSCKNNAKSDNTIYMDNLNNSTTDAFFW